MDVDKDPSATGKEMEGNNNPSLRQPDSRISTLGRIIADLLPDDDWDEHVTPQRISNSDYSVDVTDSANEKSVSKLDQQSSQGTLRRNVSHPDGFVDYHVYLTEAECGQSQEQRRNNNALLDGHTIGSLSYEEACSLISFEATDSTKGELLLVFNQLPIPSERITFDGAVYILGFDLDGDHFFARKFDDTPDGREAIPGIWKDGEDIYILSIASLVKILEDSVKDGGVDIPKDLLTEHCSIEDHEAEIGMEAVIVVLMAQWLLDFADPLQHPCTEGVKEMTEILTEWRQVLQEASHNAWAGIITSSSSVNSSWNPTLAWRLGLGPRPQRRPRAPEDLELGIKWAEQHFARMFVEPEAPQVHSLAEMLKANGFTVENDALESSEQTFVVNARDGGHTTEEPTSASEPVTPVYTESSQCDEPRDLILHSTDPTSQTVGEPASARSFTVTSDFTNRTSQNLGELSNPPIAAILHDPTEPPDTPVANVELTSFPTPGDPHSTEQSHRRNRFSEASTVFSDPEEHYDVKPDDRFHITPSLLGVATVPICPVGNSMSGMLRQFSRFVREHPEVDMLSNRQLLPDMMVDIGVEGCTEDHQLSLRARGHGISEHGHGDGGVAAVATISSRFPDSDDVRGITRSVRRNTNNGNVGFMNWNWNWNWFS